MATAMATARRAKRSNFKKASTALARNNFGPSTAQQRQYQDQATQAASQGLAPVAQQVAQANLGGPQIASGAASPMEIAAQSANLRQQAIGATSAWRDKMALQQQAQATALVDKEMAERRARRAKILAVGASLALGGIGTDGAITGLVGGLADKAGIGSVKKNILGASETYLTKLGDMYDPSKRQSRGEQ